MEVVYNKIGYLLSIKKAIIFNYAPKTRKVGSQQTKAP